MNAQPTQDCQGQDRASLILFVTGEAPRSRRARLNLAAAIEAVGLDDIADQEVDLLDDPEQAVAFTVFATPALVHVDAAGKRTVLYGDLSDTRRLREFLSALG